MSDVVPACVPDEPDFAFIDPPFQLNARKVQEYPPEISGNYLLRCLCHRLGWPSLAGKRLLDFGCGVRFARTIVNLGLDIGCYAGVDVKADMIAWLKENISDPRLRFAHMNIQNPMYNPTGLPFEAMTRVPEFQDLTFDAACMFSVMTHQAPEAARGLLVFLRRMLGAGGRLYFTAFLDPETEGFAERKKRPGLASTYNPAFLRGLVTDCGWRVERQWPKSTFQQAAILCRAV